MCSTTHLKVTVISEKEDGLQCIACTRKSEPLSVKNFVGDNEIEFIVILLTVTLGYGRHFYKVSKRSVAN